jgi:8-oxo-dGTP diphosphatase
MVEVRFYDDVADSQLKYAVIISQSAGRWVFCKHRERTTYECPGGHRETGEDILTTAKRELFEETGALAYSIRQICPYSVTKNGENEPGEETFGMLYFADIAAFAGELHSEMETVLLTDTLPEHLTYPEIHPTLMERALETARKAQAPSAETKRGRNA